MLTGGFLSAAERVFFYEGLMLHLSVGKHYLEGFQFRSSYVSLHSVSVGYNFMSDLIPIFPSCIPELRNPI